ncbi:hypothetical protein GLU60_01090 [Nanohaloarchaea archaeon H01]|nr:hypothetical protein [Nanohaloarchaea archaeon H01]
MEHKTVAMIFGSMLLIFFILLSIRMQVSMIDGLSETTRETNQRLGYKAAGSFHFMMQGDRMGVIDEERYSDLKTQGSSGSCFASLPGFEDGPLLFSDSRNCGEVERPLKLGILVQDNREEGMVQFNVGETSEGFQ